MSKNTKTVNKPLSEKAKMTIWIVAIVAIAVVVLVVSLALINNSAISPDDSDSSNNGTTSNFNGSFLYVDSDETSYPYAAQNWDKKTYEKPSSDVSHNFGKIETSENVLMGVVNTTESVWNDKVKDELAAQGIANVTNPGVHNKDAIDQVAVEDGEVDVANVYMIATKTATNASIYSSQSFSISSLASKKISVWLNTAQVTSGNVSVKLQANNTSALEKHWYAYDDGIVKETVEADNGWVEHVFYIFNRSSASKSVRINIGLGNVYTGANAEGILFVDDITYEDVTANEYRKHYNDTAKTSHVIPATDNEDADIFARGWTGGTTVANGVTGYLALDAAKVDGVEYSPFVPEVDDFNIYTATTSQKLVLESNINMAQNSYNLPGYIHAYFWVRVVEGTTLPQADAIKVTVTDTATNEELASTSTISAINDIVEDTNCGWQQFHVYVKPDQEAQTAEISIAIDWSIDTATTPHDGTIYVSDAKYEFVDDSKYSGSSSTTRLNVDMSVASASTGVTNGSFSLIADVTNVNGATRQPESWKPVFAGSNTIYNDGGKGYTEITGLNTTSAAIAGSGLVTSKTGGANFDDPRGYYLAVTNALETSHGYLSQDITLSANSIYQISVVAKGNPYIYLINDSLATGTADARKQAIVSSFEASATNNAYIDELLCQESQSEWVRYYFIVETSNESVTLNVALFNGKIDGSTKGAAGTTTYYDQVVVGKIGSWAVAEDTDNEDATLYKVTYSANGNGYSDLFGEDKIFANVDGKTTTINPVSIKDGENEINNLKVTQLTEGKWDELRAIPEAEEEVEDETPAPETSNDIDIALLLSVISSVALVAALAVVVVIRLFKRRKA